MVSARELIKWAEQELSGANSQISNPALDALILLSEVTQLSRTRVLFQEEIERDDESKFRTFIARRLTGEPIQYITGRAYFRNLDLAVGPGVLIPRPESESLISFIISTIKESAQPRVLDLGAGSGALALAIATEVPAAEVVAVERERQAVRWLQENVSKYKKDITVLQIDVAEFDGKSQFDAVIANPPYIPHNEDLPREIADFEPDAALFGGTFGLDIPNLFIQAAQRSLKSGGVFAIEHHENQGEQIEELLAPYFEDVYLHYDLNDRPRFSSGVRK